MTEEKENVQEEVPVQEAQSVQEDTQKAESDEKVESAPRGNADHNWDQVRQVLQMQKQEIEELKKRLEEKVKPIPQEEPDELDGLDPQDYVTVEKAAKLAEKKAEKKAVQAARQIVEEYIHQQTVQSDEQRMRSKHEDYDYIVENFAIPLIKNDPALAHKIQTSKNPAETAYKLGKLSDAYEEQTVKQKNSNKAEKILKNSSRPVSATSVGTPLKNQADQFTNLSPSQIWEMSQKYARGS